MPITVTDTLKVQLKPTANLYAWLDEPVYTIQDKVDRLYHSKLIEALSFVDLIDYTKKPGLFFRVELIKLISKYIDESFILSDYLEVVPPIPGVKYLFDSFVLSFASFSAEVFFLVLLVFAEEFIADIVAILFSFFLLFEDTFFTDFLVFLEVDDLLVFFLLTAI